MDVAAYDALRDNQDSHWWFVGRRAIIHSILDRFVGSRPDAKVLEAGCGFGGNFRMLESYGRVHAFEFNDQAREYAARQTTGPVTYGALPNETGFDDTKFDLIVILDVLEHIDDDLGSLASLRDRLSDGGSLLITVPAVPALWSEHDVLHHHKRRYSKRQLEKKLAEAGLSIRSIGYFNLLLFPLAAAQRVISRLGVSAGNGSAPNALLNSLLTKIFSFEAALLHRVAFPVGLSLYAVVTKSSQNQ